MKCPYCQAPAQENTPHCAECGFALERLGGRFGLLPPHQRGLTDAAGVLAETDAKRLRAAFTAFSGRFPQLAFSLITVALPAEYPIHVHAFRLLNQSGMCAPLECGGHNRDLVLVLDAARGQAALIIGYGLEPFVSSQVLQEILDSGAPHFASAAWAPGVEAVLEETERRLALIVKALGSTYGLTPAELRLPAEPVALGEVVAPY